MSPGAIMPKNSPIVDINQFSGDFRFTHPQEQVHPITPQGPGLLGTCPCRTPGPLAFGAAGHRWGPQGEQNADKAGPVWQRNRRRWCPGASEPRESRKKPGGEGDGAVSGRLMWWRVLRMRWWFYRQDQLRIPGCVLSPDFPVVFFNQNICSCVFLRKHLNRLPVDFFSET